MRDRLALLMAAIIIFASVGCSKKQLVPGILAGTGAAAIAGGVIYRVSLPEEDKEGLLGRQPQQKAGVAILLFAGAALVLAGVIWSATTPLCESDVDCWRSDVCNKATGTCVPKPATEELAPAAAATLHDDLALRAPPHIPRRFALRIHRTI